MSASSWVVRQRGWPRATALLAAHTALTLLACSDDRSSIMSDSPSTIADELKKNAEAFVYTIGQPGGTLTLATI